MAGFPLLLPSEVWFSTSLNIILCKRDELPPAAFVVFWAVVESAGA